MTATKDMDFQTALKTAYSELRETLERLAAYDRGEVEIGTSELESRLKGL